jgi:hypothetical protein
MGFSPDKLIATWQRRGRELENVPSEIGLRVDPGYIESQYGFALDRRVHVDLLRITHAFGGTGKEVVWQERTVLWQKLRLDAAWLRSSR